MTDDEMGPLASRTASPSTFVVAREDEMQGHLSAGAVAP